MSEELIRKLSPIEELALLSSDRLGVAADYVKSPGRPELPNFILKQHKAERNRRYRERGLYKTIGVRAETADAVARLARQHGMRKVDLVHQAVEQWAQEKDGKQA